MNNTFFAFLVAKINFVILFFHISHNFISLIMRSLIHYFRKFYFEVPEKILKVFRLWNSIGFLFHMGGKCVVTSGTGLISHFISFCPRFCCFFGGIIFLYLMFSHYGIYLLDQQRINWTSCTFIWCWSQCCSSLMSILSLFSRFEV